MPRKPANYEVGYKKPPVQTRFQPGVSGNPKGKDKGAKTMRKHLQAELKQRIPITENGKRRNITKGQAIIKQTVNKAVSGDPKATALILAEDRNHAIETATAAASAAPEAWAYEEDLKVIVGFLERLRGDETAEGDDQ